MRSGYLPLIEGKLSYARAYSFPIHDDYGLDDEARVYFDLEDLSKEERELRERMMAWVKRIYVKIRETRSDQPFMYGPGGITSGIRPSEKVREHNERVHFDPSETIKTTYKIDRHFGGELIKKFVTAANVEDNLRYGAQIADLFPGMQAVVPVILEELTKEFIKNPDLTNGQGFEGEIYMALWLALEDIMERCAYNGPLLHSRNTDHEVWRAIALGARYLPGREDQDMILYNALGEDVDIMDVVNDAFDVCRYQVGAGIEPKEIATFLARMDMLYDHLNGKETKISIARFAADMAPLPKEVAANLQQWANSDEYKKKRKKINEFLKKHCLTSLRNIHELDDNYQKWLDKGYGQMPAYTDGLHRRIRSRLEDIADTSTRIETLILSDFSHKQDNDAQDFATKKDDLLRFISDMERDMQDIQARRDAGKAGHWNLDLESIKEDIQSLVKTGKIFETASPKNEQRITSLAKDIHEKIVEIRNKSKVILDDKSVSLLREEAKEIGARDMKKEKELISKPVDSKKRMSIIKYSTQQDVFDDDHTGRIFIDDIAGNLSARHAAEIPPMVKADLCVTPALDNPYQIHLMIDLALTGPDVDYVSQDGVGNIKNLTSIANDNMSPESFHENALQRCLKAQEWLREKYPKVNVVSSINNARIYDTIAQTPEATAKKTSSKGQKGSANWTQNAKTYYETKETQLKAERIVFDHGWWAKESLVTQRVRAIEMQLGGFKRPNGTSLEIHTLPCDMDDLDIVNELAPDSLYESIKPLSDFVRGELQAGRKVPSGIALGLLKMLQIHAMLEDPTLIKDRISNADAWFNSHDVNTNLIAYRNDLRAAEIGAINRENSDVGIYQEFCDFFKGLYNDPALVKEIPPKYLEDQVMGKDFIKMQESSKGKQAFEMIRRRSTDQIHLQAG